MASPLWTADELWALPPNPYRNHTPRTATVTERLKWLLVACTLFLPRLLLVVLTGAPSSAATSAVPRGGPVC